MRYLLALLLIAPPLAAVERAAYDSLGQVIALLSDREDLNVTSSIVAVLPNGKRIPVQTRTPRTPLTREGTNLSWAGSFLLPDEGRGKFQLRSEEDDYGVRYSIAVAAETLLDVAAIEWTLNLATADFVGGRVTPDG